jgi:hypothetical protein
MQAEVILHYENVSIRNIGQGEALHRKYERLSQSVSVRHMINQNLGCRLERMRKKNGENLKQECL